MLDRLKALMLLDECTGYDIWSVDHCRQRGVPSAWIAQLADAFESGFRRDEQTIYVDDRPVNQYHGIHDLQLARRLGEHLGVDVARLESMIPEQGALVRAIKEAVEEG